MKDFGLYVIITNPTLSYGEIAEICVRQQIGMLQLREKNLSDKQLLEAARLIKSITKGSKTKFVMNDRADIAVLSDADFLHLGQDDLSLAEARRIVGPDMGIGLSTHSIDQAKKAIAQQPDYIGFGPVYKTTTKKIADPTVGVELLSDIIHQSPVPVVAIGGIFPENIDTILRAGARNFSLVRYLMETTQTEQRIMQVKELFHSL